MKNDRQTAVLQIIEETAVETQEQLMQLLAERGFACTQATVSRDIKQLHLIKAPDPRCGLRAGPPGGYGPRGPAGGRRHGAVGVPRQRARGGFL